MATNLPSRKSIEQLVGGDGARGTSLWKWMLGDAGQRCPRCVQTLPRRWWRQMQSRHYRCACGAWLTTRVSTAWQWSLVLAGAVGVGVGIEMADLSVWESGLAAGVCAAALGWLDRFLFTAPQRSPVGRSLAG